MQEIKLIFAKKKNIHRIDHITETRGPVATNANNAPLINIII